LQCLERGAIKFSFGEAHTWQQYALSLLAIGEHVHALRVLEEVHRLTPQSATFCLLAAKTCYLNTKDVSKIFKQLQQKLNISKS
jgi:hypothetical protein